MTRIRQHRADNNNGSAKKNFDKIKWSHAIKVEENVSHSFW